MRHSLPWYWDWDWGLLALYLISDRVLPSPAASTTISGAAFWGEGEEEEEE
jgi:hypothetical protein